MPSQTLFLEDWLRSCSDSRGPAKPPPSSNSSSAQKILQSWSILREKSAVGDRHDRSLEALQTLADLRSSLHVADPQVKLLLSDLSSSSPASRLLVFRLLSIWARKSSRPSPSLLQSAISVLLPLLVCSRDEPFPSHGVLLLGAFSASPAITDDSRRICLDLICKLLREDLPMSGGLPEEFVPEILAGIGYALANAGDDHFVKITASLLGFWSVENGPCASLPHGLMILSLVEWLVSGFIASNSIVKIESFCHGFSGGDFSKFAVVMASAGVLRAFRRASPNSKLRLTPPLRNSMESSISAIAEDLLSRINDEQEDHLLLQCIAIALARCGPFNFHASVLKCICLALLHEIFPLLSLLGRILPFKNATAGGLDLQRVRAHAGGVLFKEAGAISGVLCSMYSAADGATQEEVEDQIWRYCHEFYIRFRSVFFQIKGKELAGVLEEIAEAFFLMVVLFYAEATKKTLALKKVRSSFSVKVLSSFSCVEYLRRIRLPEYTDAVRRAVLAVQDDPAACLMFVDSMPSYAELTNPPGFDYPEGERYNWADDEIQTARILFYLRVIPTCISRLPGSIFGKTVAPTMFLYMHHDLEKVARSAHSIFTSFITSGMDHNDDHDHVDDDDELGLKEKLVFYYIERSLEAYPGRTPFEGMASGVAALARHLPAGSPAVFYCIRSLVEKAFSLYTEEDELGKNIQEEDSEPYRKILDLLVHLITIVDIQALPYLLKQMAWFTGQLPKEGKNMVLGELHALVAESDDVTRKPTLVSWVQSLSYLSSQTETGNNLINPRGTNSIRPRL